MNKKIISIALALALPLTVAAFPGDKDAEHFGGHRGDKIEHLAKQLDLNAEQKTKLTDIFTQERAKRDALRQETHSKMQEVLSPEQMTKLDEIKKDRHEKWQKRHENRKNKPHSEMPQ